jgi:hypothetical protein
MKRKKIRKQICCIILISLFVTKLFSQDKIFKPGGDSLTVKILEIGATTISYKNTGDLNGPTFTEQKSNIAYIKLANGQIEKFGSNVSLNTNAAVNDQNGKVKIEHKNDSYFIDERKVKLKEVNKQLSQSKNPLVILPLKAAKATNLAQKIIKVLSFPTTIGGSCATLVTGINMYNDIRRGRDNTKTYVSAFSSLLGTISLPITNAILKKRSDKMYDKIISAYNLTN